jgi:hypothetical protein
MSLEDWAAAITILMAIDLAAALTVLAIVVDRTPGSSWRFSLKALLIAMALIALNLASIGALLSGRFR